MRVEGAGGQVLGAVELARVGDPLVDEDEAGAVLLEELLQGRARVGASTVGIGDKRVAFCPAELPGQLAPERVDLDPVAPGVDGARPDLGADEHGAIRLRQRADPRILEQLIDAEQILCRRTSGDVVEREQGVRLAAAEVGLQVDDRIAAVAVEAFDRLGQQLAQALSDEGAAEELGRVLILARGSALVHLVQVGGELGLLVAAAGDVAVRPHHVAPRLEAFGRGRLEERRRDLLRLAAAVLVVADAQQFLLLLVELVGLLRRDGGEQALHAVEHAVGVVGREGLLVRPAVARRAQLADERALVLPQHLAEHRVPHAPHRLEQELDVVEGRCLGAPRVGVRVGLEHGDHPVVAVGRLELRAPRTARAPCSAAAGRHRRAGCCSSSCGAPRFSFRLVLRSDDRLARIRRVAAGSFTTAAGSSLPSISDRLPVHRPAGCPSPDVPELRVFRQRLLTSRKGHSS